ncbi:MAG: hypothetical protein ABIS50_16020 [Luteolibacter sp.]|uniref:hypothetical protein n=1 Tax=Luteolibacter sp. TaxID=1962973 RepID=UPI00326763AD
MRKTLICLFLACGSLQADDDTFRERFADPATRRSALAELIPGSREAYFHTALDHQLAGREAEFAKTMADWKAASERKENAVSATGMQVLENRQLLMDYQKDPIHSLAELIRKLDLKFDDERPDAAAAAESLPTRVDPEWISEAAFEKAVAKESPEQPYTGYNGERRLRELERVEQFDEAKIRWFLQNLDRADLPGVVPLIDRAMNLKHPVKFDDIALREKLTSTQLASLLELHPDLRSNLKFDLLYLTKLRPGAETDFERDPQAHAAHLGRCRDFVLTLPPALNSLKAHVLFHHLRLQEDAGNYPKEDFLTFLALPRTSHSLLKIPDAPNLTRIQFESDFATATECPPVHDDLKLIQSYLQHFLGETDSSAEFAPFIEANELAHLHARARLLAGADPARWGTAIDPAEYKSLQEEARIGFAPGAPVLLDSDATVALKLDLKNTPDVLIRIYELDLPAQLARGGGEPDVSIDLDGLVPHHERHLTFSQAPILLHRETIGLPELTGSGAWLVDFVGGQVSARALIRKGQLIPYVERTASGQTVRVFDEKGNPVMNTTARLGRETLTADTSGLIIIPNAPNDPFTRGIVQAGKLAAALDLGSRTDQLAMDARFHLEREQLLADDEAKLHLRVRLTNHGYDLPLDRIADPALVLKAELLGGVITERVIAEDLKLTSVLEVPFQVPADLLKLTLTLRGTVTPATGGEPIKLSQVASYEINGDLKDSRVATAFFSPTTEGHRLEVRGRNGERLPSRAITLECHRLDFKESVKLQVRTDADGRVNLGKLDAIDSLTATGSDIAKAIYQPKPGNRNFPEELRLRIGTEIRLPVEQADDMPDHLKLSLLETLDQIPIRDHFDKISFDAGDLVIHGLPAGNFVLTQGEHSTEIEISPGVENGGLLVSKTRVLPVFSPRSPAIQSAAIDGDQVRIQLRNSGPDTRVTLVGNRFRHYWNSGPGLYPFTPAIPDTLDPGFTGCGYLIDRRLGDEMRYILDRRAANTFPGSMLPRPGMLLNRWTEEDDFQSTLSGGSGSGGSGRSAAKRSSMTGNRPSSRGEDTTDSKLAIVCDFLGMPAVVKFDLKPNADGSLSVPLAEFNGSQFIEIVATDAFASDELRLPLPASDTPLRDRRIARPLDPQTHFLATRSAAVLQKDAEASIENLLDADWRAFTTLSEAQQFLYGMTGDERMREFAFLPDWPDFTEEKKLELLTTHACHEFHLFLARKDKTFFEKHVKPMLAQKPEPTFIDDFLLGRDLKSYLRPYAWQRLNAAEKALLSQALPEARERISGELSLRWQLEAPAPDAETTLFTQTLRGSDLALQDSLGLARKELAPMTPDSYGSDSVTDGVAYITDKLRRIVIPRIDFEDTTVEEAIDFLRLRAAEMDTTELDPAKKGINYVIRRPRAAAGGESLPEGSDPGSLRIRELRLRNVPIAVVLKYICDQTKLRYKVDDFAVTLVPQTETGEDIFTRTFRVPPDFASALSSDDEAGEADPFAEPGRKSMRLTARRPIMELLKQAGITFPEGTSATLSANGILLLTNSPSELDKVQQLVDVIGSPAESGAAAAGAGDVGMLPPLPDLASVADAMTPPAFGNQSESAGNFGGSSDPFAATAGAARLEVRPPVFADRTRLWLEANYYQNTKPTGESLIPLNRFWLDLAAWDGKGSFLSPHFNACHTTANEALMCLALLDLPFKADRPEVKVDGSTLRVKAREPMLLFYKDTRRTEKVAEESPVLVRQTFSPLAEPFRTVNGRQVENPVTGDFRPGIPYSESLVVTNPTGIGRRIDVLAQIPAGAIPLQGKLATLSSTHELKPYGVVMLEMAFYFPVAGDFQVYPMQVSEDGTILADTKARTLRVSNDPAPVDAASWGVLANEGSSEEVLNRLRTENLKTLDLSAIRWRLRDAAFFLDVTAILRERLFFSPAVAAYGFRHNDLATIREYLENSKAVAQLGDWLDSPLLDVRPRVHHDWETLEFDPLVNARAHRFANESRLTHEAARKHYQAFLDQAGWKPSLDAADQLTLTAFLFLQDRIEEGLARFDLIDPAKLPGRLNYDYLRTVVLFHREKAEDAKAIAVQTLPSLPPGLWRDRFQAVVDQADEIAALDHPVENAKPEELPPAPQLDLTVATDGKLVIKHRSLEKAQLRLFSVDLEVLFSKDPFLQGDGSQGGDPAIRPNADLEVTLDKNSAETTVDFPERMKKGNLLVSAESGTKKILKVLDSRALEIRQSPVLRTIQVLDAVTSKPLPKTYVKVYAEMNNGEMVFHKDGYTDLRGKFDYLSNTAVDPSTVKRVAILVSHPEKGARTVIYDR